MSVQRLRITGGILRLISLACSLHDFCCRDNIGKLGRLGLLLGLGHGSHRIRCQSIRTADILLISDLMQRIRLLLSSVETGPALLACSAHASSLTVGAAQS